MDGFQGCKIALIVESNLGNECESQELALRFAKIKDVVVMNEDTSNERLGVRTSALLKRSMALLTGILLMHDKIKFHYDLFSSHKDNKAMDLRKEFLNQLLNYKRIIKPQSTDWDEARETYTGKKGGKDDICMAFQLGIYMKQVAFAKKDKYSMLFS